MAPLFIREEFLRLETLFTDYSAISAVDRIVLKNSTFSILTENLETFMHESMSVRTDVCVCLNGQSCASPSSQHILLTLDLAPIKGTLVLKQIHFDILQWYVLCHWLESLCMYTSRHAR